MKKTVFSLLALIISVSTLLTGCGSKAYDRALPESTMENGYTIYEDAIEEEPQSLNVKAYASQSTGSTYESESYSIEVETLSENFVPEAIADRKIIYSSSYSIHTTEFEKTVSALDALCQKYGAYYENSETYGTKENANRNGSFTVRVPVQNYNAFKSETGNIGVVVRSSENNRDVTENYIDTEARLASAKVREERLIAILEKADTLDDVLLLEAELADVRYEIESLSGSLRKYDSLISYSTISVNINEVIEPVEIKPIPKTFSQKISASVSDGFDDFSRDMEYLFLDVLYNLPGIIIFIVTIVIICVIIKIVIRKIKKKFADSEPKTEEQTDETKE